MSAKRMRLCREYGVRGGRVIIMRRDKAINILKKQLPTLNSQYHVRHLSLFGSVARDEASKKSDVDILVEFEGESSFDLFMDLKFFLEDTLNSPVDLVTTDAVRPRMRPLIEREAIHVS